MKRRDLKGDSLELFLDTICNTFGGILFIALLVAILLQSSGRSNIENPQNKPVDKIEYIKAENKLDQLKDNLEHLKSQTDMLARQNKTVASSDKKVLIEQMLKEQKILEEQIETQSRLISENLETNQKINETYKDLQERRKVLNQDKKDFAKENKKLNKETSQKSARQRLPQFRTTTKREVVALVRFGRFYLWHKYKNGIRVGLNTDDILITEDEREYRLTMPNILRGIDLKAKNAEKLVKEKIEQFETSEFQITIVVWPDSFEEYKVARNVIVDNGFDYSPLPAQEKSFFIDRGGSDREVQ